MPKMSLLKFDKKAYDKKYYWNKVRPHRVFGSPYDMYQCVYCGFYNNKRRLMDQKFFDGIYVRSGCVYHKPEDLPDNIQYLLFEKQREIFKNLAFKSMKFLNICIKNNLLLKEELIKYFDLQNPINSYYNFSKSVNVGFFAIKSYDPIYLDFAEAIEND